jgi:hypothetical protein
VLIGFLGFILSESDQSFFDGEGVTFGDGEQMSVKHGLVMPCTGSDGNNETLSWVVTFTAVLP